MDEGERVIRDYIQAQADLDVDAMMALLTPDAIFEFPYAVAGMDRIAGGDPAALRAHNEMMPNFIKSFEFTNIEVDQLKDEGRYLVQLDVRGVLLKEAPVYENRYCIVVTLRDGKVSHWREYFDAVSVSGLLASLAA